MPNESTTHYALMDVKNEEQHYLEDNAVPKVPQVGAPPPPDDTTQQVQLFLGPKNSLAKCPHCGARVRTTVKHTATTRTHMIAALCCSFCCMCCIPYCMNSTRNTDHYCPNCANYIGSYEK